ncbi:MAG: hypothetical protein ACLS3Y_04420 [Collinsella sp.]
MTTITDNGDGTSATHVLKDVGEAKFVNSYKPGSMIPAHRPDHRDQVLTAVTKAGEFRLSSSRATTRVATGTNNADGRSHGSRHHTAAGELTPTRCARPRPVPPRTASPHSTAEYTIVPRSRTTATVPHRRA